MFRKLSVVILFVFLVVLATSADLEAGSFFLNESIIRVPEDYSTIQAAVDAAFPGDTILVAAGFYHENVLINKSVKIIGEDCDSTVVEGAEGFLFSSTIHVMAHYVEISGLTVQKESAGILLNHSSHCTIHDNILTVTTYWGGIVLRYSNENTIANNTAFSNGGGDPPLQYGVGIAVSYSNRNVISSNTVTDNVAGSLVISSSHHNTVINNTVYEDKSGIALSSSTWNNVVANNVYSNTETGGIGLHYSANNTIENNKLIGNGGGITGGYSPMNTIKGNTIINSSHAGIDVSDNSPGNLVVGNTISNNMIGIKIIGSNFSYFYHNNFINNLNNHPWDEQFPSVNFWNNSFGEGNYWSNYSGVDTNRDGIGDSPHFLYASNQDYYPLMSPYMPGDCNHDGIVSIKDATLIGLAWNKTKGETGYNPHADLNMDMVINMADAEVIRKNWFTTFHPP